MSQSGDSATPVGPFESFAEGVGRVRTRVNVGIVLARRGALVIDTGPASTSQRVVEALRQATPSAVHHVVYTHGHADHLGGTASFVQDARARVRPRPTVWGHANVLERLARYARTWRWHDEAERRLLGLPHGTRTFPHSFVPPDRTYREREDFELDGERVELYHAHAETNDATWVWLPERRIAFVGDLLVDSLPNAGQPDRTAGSVLGWAQALDAIAAQRPRWVLPGHGAPLEGMQAVEVLSETARALRFLHDAVIERLNAGRWPDEIVEEDLRLPATLAGLPHLQETRGCVAFVVRDVLRANAGWWGGRSSEILPAPRAAVARDVVELAGRDAILERVGMLFVSGDARRALHFAVLLREANPTDREAWQMEAELCAAIAGAASSRAASALFLACAASAREALEALDRGEEKVER